VLQAYALQKQVQELTGANAHIINFQPWSLVNFYGANPFQSGLPARDRIGRLLYGHRKRRKRKIFDQFLDDHLHLTELVRTRADLSRVASDFEILVTGSDQVWNPYIAKEQRQRN
jgi:hypothetical protein